MHVPSHYRSPIHEACEAQNVRADCFCHYGHRYPYVTRSNDVPSILGDATAHGPPPYSLPGFRSPAPPGSWLDPCPGQSTAVAGILSADLGALWAQLRRAVPPSAGISAVAASSCSLSPVPRHLHDKVSAMTTQSRDRDLSARRKKRDCRGLEPYR